MLFAHDTEAALVSASALINTDNPDGDALADVPALVAFLRDRGWTGSRRVNATELHEVHTLRTQLRALWESDEDQVVDRVNQLLRDRARCLNSLRTDPGVGTCTPRPRTRQ